ncbi:MAG: O-antigen ligase family protein, partial [Candidatus Binatia bacterium]
MTVSAAPLATPRRGTFHASQLKLATDPYRRLVAILLIMTISRIHQHFGFLDPLRPALVLTILAGAYAYMNPRFLHPGIFETRPAKLILAMGFMACLSVPFGISMGASGRFIIEDYSKVILFAFLVIAGVRFTRDLYTFIWAFVASIGFLSYLSLFVFKMTKATSDGVSRILNGYSYDANDIGTVAVVGLPLVLLALTTSTGKKKMVAAFILLGVGGTIAKTGSRGAFLGLIAVGIGLLVMLKSVPVAKRLAFVAVTAVALAFFAPAGYWEQMKTLTSPKEDYNWTSPTGRREVFKRGVNYTVRHPLTGLGIENFARAEGTLSDRAIAQARDPSLPGIKWSAPHNSFLQAAAELGIPG